MTPRERDRRPTAPTLERDAAAEGTTVPDRHPDAVEPAGLRAVNAEDVTKGILLYALRKIPVVGAEAGLLGGLLLDQLFPKGGNDLNVWNDIKGRVEALIKKKIDETIWELRKSTLQGLHNVYNEYRKFAKDLTKDSSEQDKRKVAELWENAHSSMNERYPEFQTKNFEVLLLPLFVQVANLHIALLRDYVIHGVFWGEKDTAVAKRKAQLSVHLTRSNKRNDGERFIDWVLFTFEDEYKARFKDAAGWDRNYSAQKQWDAVSYNRETWISSAQTATEIWPYFDLTTWPKGKSHGLEYECFMGPYGSPRNVDAMAARKRRGTLKGIAGWHAHRFDAVQCNFSTGWGPKMGSSGGNRSEKELDRSSYLDRWAVCYAKFDNACNRSEYGVHSLELWGAEVTEGNLYVSWVGSDKRCTRYENQWRAGYLVTSVNATGANPANKAADAVYIGLMCPTLMASWSAGRTYRISGGADARMLDLAAYSRAEGTPAALADLAPVPSQEWTIEAADGGACRLVNSYTGARLGHDGHGNVVQTHATEGTAWRIEPSGLTTCKLRPDGGELLLTGTGDGLVLASAAEGEADPAQGWWLLPVPAPRVMESEDLARPTVTWEAVPGATSSRFRARLRLSNPGDAPTRTGWELSFDLPPEVTDLMVDEGEVTAETSQGAASLHVVLRGRGTEAADLAAGAAVECVLSGPAEGDGSGVVPIGFQVDGTHVPAT